MATPPPRPTVHAFIDESGDRGFKLKASDYFVMSAVIVKDEDLPAAEALRLISTNQVTGNLVLLPWGE